MKSKIAFSIIALMFSISALAAPSLGPAEEIYQVQCSYLNDSQTDWDADTTTLDEMNFAINWCEATGGLAQVFFDADA